MLPSLPPFNIYVPGQLSPTMQITFQPGLCRQLTCGTLTNYKAPSFCAVGNTQMIKFAIIMRDIHS